MAHSQSAGASSSKHIVGKAAIFQNNLTNENSIKNAQREIKIKYLLDSYLKIANVANRDSEPFINAFLYYKSIEPAISTASVFGDSALIYKINKFAFTKPPKDDILPVIYELRKELRQSLGLPLLNDSLNTADSSYNITFYRRWIKDSMFKTNPEFYKNLQMQIANENINRNFNR